MKGAAHLLFVLMLLSMSACGGTSQPTRRSPTPNPVSIAWHRCGDSRIPPSSVTDFQFPPSTQIISAPDVRPDESQDVVSAYALTNAIVTWAIGGNDLGILQGRCIAAPFSHTEDDDIGIIQKAKAIGGHAKFEPDPVPIRIGVEHVSATIAAKVQSRTSIRPSFALILVEPGAVVWVVNKSGQHIKKLAESNPNGLYATVMVGVVRNDAIGHRFLQGWQYSCTDPEVVGVCDGVL